MARGVDERDRTLVALQLREDLVGADGLRDATRLALADVGLADRVEQSGLSVVDVTHDRDDRRPELEVVVVARVLAEGDVETVEQLAVLLLGADDLHHVVHLGAEQLEDLVGHRLGGGDHLTEVEQHLHQRGRVRVDLVGEVRQRGTAGELDRLATALRQADAADRGSLHRVELLALLPLRLAALAGRPAGTAERTRGTAATTRTTGTATAATGTTAEAAACGGTATTGTAATGTEAAAAATGTTGTGTAGTTARTTGTTTGATGAATTGTRPRSGRTRRHHAGVRTRRHVAGSGGTRTALTGATRAGTTGTRATGTWSALAGGTLARSTLARSTLRGCGRSRSTLGRSRGRARTRGGRAGRGAGTDAERVVGDPGRAALRAGTRAGLLGRDDRARTGCGSGLPTLLGRRTGRSRRGLRRGRLLAGRGGRTRTRSGTRAGAGGTRGIGACRGRRRRGAADLGRLGRRDGRLGRRDGRLSGRGRCGRGLRSRGTLRTRTRSGHGGVATGRSGHGAGTTGLGGTVAAADGLPQLAGDGGLDGGGGRLHVLPEILQLAQDLLA